MNIDEIQRKQKQKAKLFIILGFCGIIAGAALITLGCTVLSYYPFGDPWFSKSPQIGAVIPGAFLCFLSIVLFASGFASTGKVHEMEGKVTSKRTEVSGGGKNSSASTSYYVTVESDEGERKEFIASSKHYGQISDKDKVKLTYQGRRLIEFIRLSAAEIEEKARAKRACQYCHTILSENDKKCSQCGASVKR